MKNIWVVEMLYDESKGKQRWEPTVGVGLTRDDARRELREHWRPQAGKFRITEYVPKKAKK